MTKPEVPILLFKTQKDWQRWLAKNHAKSSGIWLEFAKKGSAVQSHSYAEALDVALCYGWIDSQKKGKDQHTWLQKFSPRGAKSVWSKINREKAEKLIVSGKVKAAGMKAIESAKEDGRWKAAYAGQRTAKVPPDLQKALNRSPRAKAFFKTLDSHNRYAILFRVYTARKAETREKRIRLCIEMLEKGKTFHP